MITIIIIIHVLVIVIHQMIQSLLGQMYFQTVTLMVEQEVFADALEEGKYKNAQIIFLLKNYLQMICAFIIRMI